MVSADRNFNPRRDEAAPAVNNPLRSSHPVTSFSKIAPPSNRGAWHPRHAGILREPVA